MASRNSSRTKAVVDNPTAMVDMRRLFQNESDFVTDAIGAKGDMGLGQITPIALQDWNNNHPDEQYQHNIETLHQPDINYKVSNWLVNERAPQLLKHYGIADTLENRLATYKAGIGNVVSGKAWTPATHAYINKYKTLTVYGQPSALGPIPK